MGYSCTAISKIVLDELMKLVEHFGESSNAWKHDQNNYFYDIGREQSDGSITGTVYLMAGQYSFKKGSFKINSQGIIERFPAMDKAIKTLAESNGKKIYNERYNSNV
jgi:hypothetical protein